MSLPSPLPTKYFPALMFVFRLRNRALILYYRNAPEENQLTPSGWTNGDQHAII
jgi:hypothetical protein